MADGLPLCSPPSSRGGPQDKPRRSRRHALRSIFRGGGGRRLCTALTIAALAVLLPTYLLLPHTSTWPGK